MNTLSRYNSLLILAAVLLLSACSDSQQGTASSLPTFEGINCSTLPHWSKPIKSIQLNLKHIFCGEINRKGRVVGFHAMPNGHPPSSYRDAELADQPNRQGIYTLRNIQLIFKEQHRKGFSSMFPSHCSAEQIKHSIVYSIHQQQGKCTSPSWASCGPSNPGVSDSKFCTGLDGRSYLIASARLRDNPQRINTAFPIYQ
ncbi:MAG: EndoU domain-containing protein [Gammaproteobacteria bacterium]|nr:EndoU domain-containing protein [Gammaproteobacteria bacterium]MCF6229379.1 EndoU domain-containing protein [Gammaproteobacteria bacterium]